MLVNVRLQYISIDGYHYSSCGQVILTVSPLALLHFRTRPYETLIITIFNVFKIFFEPIFFDILLLRVDCNGFCFVNDNINIFKCPLCTRLNCITCQVRLIKSGGNPIKKSLSKKTKLFLSLSTVQYYNFEIKIML